MFDDTYFDPAYFATFGLFPPQGPLSSPYFDGCYFDPAYFDAAPCAPASSTGGHPHGWPPRRKVQRLNRSMPIAQDELLDQDGDDFFSGVI
jgi:hypothetical protein